MATRKTPTLGKGAIKVIERAVDRVFDNAKAQVLGPQAIGKRLYVGFSRELSLPGIFEAASRTEGAVPNLESLHQVLKIAGSYIDSTREKTKARVVREVQGFLTEAAAKGEEVDAKTVLGGKLQEVFSDASYSMRRIVDTEIQHAKHVGSFEGIVRINAAAGIEDPVVYFVVVRDRDLCDECKRLHMLPDGVTPRVWKMSEIGHGYHKKGESNPKMGGLHPHCRCTLATLMPGYGFKDGFVSFVSPKYDEYEKQHGMEKSEPVEIVSVPLEQIRPDPQNYEEAKQNVARGMRSATDGPVKLYRRAGQPGYELADGHHRFVEAQQRGATRISAVIDPELLKSEPLNKMAVIHDNAGQPMTVYRVQNKDGVGPMKAGLWSEMNLKWPSEDFDEPEMKAMKANGLVFGFERPEHAVEAFGQPVLDALKEHGFGLVPVQASHVVRARSGKQVMFKPHAAPVQKSEPLEKSDWQTSKYLKLLEQFGWTAARSAKHVVLTNKFFTPTRPMTISHSEMRRIGVENMENNAKDMGLIWKPDGTILVNPNHPYAEHYRRAGLLPPDPNAQRTWAPEGHTGQHMEIGKVISTKPDHEVEADYRTGQYGALFGKGPDAHKSIPAIKVMDGGDGNHYVVEGDEQLHAAKRFGMTHVPVVPG